jgi:glutathione S-transferase
VKLYYSRNLNPRVAVAVARHLGSPVEYVKASPRHPDHESAFRALNPNALVPILIEDGRPLWETDAIACRLSALAGSDFWRTGEGLVEMIQWISWGTNHLNGPASILYFDRLIRPSFSDQGADAAVIDEALRDFANAAAILDAQLDGRTWLVGDRLSYADFRVATALPFADRAGLPLAAFPNVRRWHGQLWAIDAWRDPFDGLA